MTKFAVLKLISIALFLVLRRAWIRTLYFALLLRISRRLRKGALPMENTRHNAWWKTKLPWALVLFRLSLGPGIVWLGRKFPVPALIVGCIVLALVSDIFDGVLARRWLCDTPRLRRWDTLADTAFYLGVLTLLIVPVQMLLVAFAMRGFQQGWNVELERRDPSAEPGMFAGAPPQPA